MATEFVAYGIYPDRVSFERALEALRAAEFRNSDISVILPDRDHTTRDLAAEIHSKAPEGIATGAGYAGRIREGGYLISVHCDDRTWAKRAEEILEATGGKDVVKTTEAAADYRP